VQATSLSFLPKLNVLFTINNGMHTRRVVAQTKFPVLNLGWAPNIG